MPLIPNQNYITTKNVSARGDSNANDPLNSKSNSYNRLKWSSDSTIINIAS